MRNIQRDWLVAVALAALFSFTGLADRPLMASDEPRVAGIGWEMQHTGQWWVPHLGGQPFLEQPPLFYALLGASIERFGASPGVARLPGAVASALTLLLVFALARRVANNSAGLAALLALVGIAGFFRYSHRAVVDPLLTLFVMLGYYAYVRAVFGSAPGNASRGSDARVSPPWLVAVYLAAALAFWVKGLVGVVAVGGPLAIDVLLGRRWRALASPAHLVGLPLLLAACAAWPLVLHAAEGEAAVRGFLLQNGVYRIAPGAGAGQYLGGHQNPFWYYLPKIPGQLGWIALFALPAAGWLFRGGPPPQWQLPALRFLAGVFPLGVLLLSIPGTKRGLYLMPFEPPLAVAIGAWIAAAARGDAHRSRVERAVITLCARAISALLRPIANLRGVADSEDDVARAAAGPCRAPYRVAALAFAIAVAWNVLVYPFTGHDRDLGPMAREVGERVGSEPLAGLRLEESVQGALPFYAGILPIQFFDADGMAGPLAQTGARYLLAPAYLREQIEAELGHRVSAEQNWDAVGSHYALYPLESRPRLADAVAMATQPSIKGSALSSVVEDVLVLRDSSRVSADRLEACLEAADLALLDTKIQPALWYPIESYRRLTELLLEVEGRGDPQYVADRGARAAERLWEGGLYVQLQHGEEKAASARRSGGVMSDRDARIITTLAGAIFNFTRWSYRGEGTEALIEVAEAERLPDVSMHAARGFLEYVVGRLRRMETPVRATRAARDRVEFRFRLGR